MPYDIFSPVRYIYRQAQIAWAIQSMRRNFQVATFPNPFTISVAQTLVSLAARDVKVVSTQLDDKAVAAFMRDAEYEFYYPNYYVNRDLVRLKKIREHFVAAQLLELKSNDVYLDIASQYSPAPQVYERLYGCRALRQDWEYPLGQNGRVIGGSAGNMPLEDNSVHKISLHCSLEHFEGDEDMALIREVERVLAFGGKLVIAPLYLSDQYFVVTQPSLWAQLPQEQRPAFPKDAVIYIAQNSGNRHERFYDVENFIARIVNQTHMRVSILSFGDETFCRTGQMRFVGLFEKQMQSA